MGFRDLFLKSPATPPPGSDSDPFGHVDDRGIDFAPLLIDPTTKKQAAKGIVKKWHHQIGRSMVSGQRILDVDTEIGVLLIRTRINGNLAEIFVPVGSEVVPGQALWRYIVSRRVRD